MMDPIDYLFSASWSDPSTFQFVVDKVDRLVMVVGDDTEALIEKLSEYQATGIPTEPRKFSKPTEHSHDLVSAILYAIILMLSQRNEYTVPHLLNNMNDKQYIT